MQTAILAYLRLVPGVVAWKNGTGAFRKPYVAKDGTRREHFIRIGKVGVADVIGWADNCRYPQKYAGNERLNPIPCEGRGMYHVPRFLAIEVKAEGKKSTPEQEAFLQSVRAAGGIGLVAYSVDDVRRVLDPEIPL